MKNQVFLILLGLLTGFSSFAQEDKDVAFFVEVAYDSMGLNEQLEIKYTLKNAKATASFEAPGFDGFQILAGPMSSQSMSIINGEMTQSVSYSFYLKPMDLGTFIIPSANIDTDLGPFTTQEMAVVVIQEYERPIQNNPFNNAFQDPFLNNPFFNDPFFNQGFGSDPNKRMDEMMQDMNQLFKFEPPTIYYEGGPKTPNQSPSKKPKKEEKIYKI